MKQRTSAATLLARRGLPADSWPVRAAKKTHYCSKDCYEKDWENHKTYCKHVSSEGKSSASLVPLDYFMKIATHVPKARALAREINLPMANPSGM